MINGKKQIFVIVGIFTLILALTSVTFAFFNYVRTGLANTLGTGQIHFSSSQNNTLNLTNVFPMTSTNAANANLDSVSVTIEGNTTYTNGEEFLVSIVDVTNTINGKKIPISYIATYEAVSGETIGTNSSEYFTLRENKNANIYILNETGTIRENKQILVGYVDDAGDGINGTLTIKAYVDADQIAITDTPEESSEWISGRTVFSTTEWNSFTSSPISFKIRAESNEDIWVQKEGTITTCPGCVYTHMNSLEGYWTTWNTAGITPSVLTSNDYHENYEDVISEWNKNFFLGFKLNANNQIEKAYACGVKNNKPFCIEGYYDDSKYVANQTVLQDQCVRDNNGYCDFGCIFDGDEIYTCDSAWFGANTLAYGDVDIHINNYPCQVEKNGHTFCYNYNS